jgi:hypothetical protein
MNVPEKFLRPFGWIILLCVTFAAQTIGTCQSIDPPPSKLKLKHKSRVAMRYDRFKDLTTVTVGPYFLSSGMDLVMTNSRFELLASFTYNGQKLQRPVERATIGFLSSSKDWKFLRDQSVYVLADGQRFDLGSAERDSDLRTGGVSEILVVNVPFETFAKIANSTKVEMRFGSKEIKLKDEHLEGFRDLSSRMVP